MRHQDLLFNHILESWTFASAAARNAAGAYVSGDIGRIGYQSDNGTYWRLTATTPTWAGVGSAYATKYNAPSAPTPTSSTSAVMMGLGSAWFLTPLVTGKIVLSVAGFMGNQTAGNGGVIGFRFGTGTAPAYGVAVTGTAIGTIIGISNVATNSTGYPFSGTMLGTVFVPGTQYWFDITASATPGGTLYLANLNATITELP